MSQVCEACRNAPATDNANSVYLSRLCAKCTSKCKRFVADIRGNKNPVAKPKESEYKRYIASINGNVSNDSVNEFSVNASTSTATVEDAPSKEIVNESPVNITVVNETKPTIKFSSADELLNHITHDAGVMSDTEEEFASSSSSDTEEEEKDMLSETSVCIEEEDRAESVNAEPSTATVKDADSDNDGPINVIWDSDSDGIAYVSNNEFDKYALFNQYGLINHNASTVKDAPSKKIVKDSVKVHAKISADESKDQIDAKPTWNDASDSDSDSDGPINIKRSADEEIEEESSKPINTSGKVLWYHCANVANAIDKNLSKHDEVTLDLIKRGFYEIVGKHIVSGDKVYTQDYVRLFFDFDVHTHADAISLYNKVLIPRFNKLKELFGDYSISAYSNKEPVAVAVGCRFDAKASKELSLHVVFYESRILIDDLYALTRNAKFIFPDGYDDSVYLILTRRVFRIHLGPHTGYGIKCIGKDGLPEFYPPFQLKKDGKLQFNKDGSPKMSKPDKYCPGSIIGNKPLHTQLLQPRGTEKVISLDDVIKSDIWFDMRTGITKDDIKVNVNKRIIGSHIASDFEGKLVSKEALNDILRKVQEDTVETDNDDSIERITNVNCFKYLLNCFTPDFVNLMHIFWLVIVCGPYKRELLKEIVSEWYWKGEHSTPDGDADYIDCNYVTKNREYSDIWFHCAVKRLPPALRDAFIAKYAKNSVNTIVKFDVWDDFGLCKIQEKIINKGYINYGDRTIYDKKARKNALSLGGNFKVKKLKDADGNVKAIRIKDFPYIKFGDIFSDLRRCFAIIDSTPMEYIFKDLDGGSGKYIQKNTTHPAIARDKLKKISIKYIANDMTYKSIDLWTLLSANNNSSYLTYPAADFYSTIPTIFSYYYPPFQKCAYDTIDTTITDYHQMNNLERWIHHVNAVICDGDANAIEYVHAWIARPLQNPLQKNKTALIVKDTHQGSGKSWFAEVVARLHGGFGKENVSMKSICGDFNSIIDKKTLILCNEVKNVDNSKYYDDDKLKGLITDAKTDIEYKCENSDVHHIYANFIFVSNNNTPIKVTDKDRRYVVLKPSSAHATIDRVQDTDYWTPEFYALEDDKEFLAQLYSYYMNLDIKHYNPANIPTTLALNELIEESRPRIYYFILDNYYDFKNGWITTDAFNAYKEWCIKRNYNNIGNADTFRHNISEYIVWNPKYTHGKDKPPSKVLPVKKHNARSYPAYKLNDEYKDRFFSLLANIENTTTVDGERPITPAEIKEMQKELEDMNEDDSTATPVKPTKKPLRKKKQTPITVEIKPEDGEQLDIFDDIYTNTLRLPDEYRNILIDHYEKLKQKKSPEENTQEESKKSDESENANENSSK